MLEELLNVSKELQDGLLQFKETKSSNTDLECLLREKRQEKLLPFTQRLQELLVSIELRDVPPKMCALLFTRRTKMFDGFYFYLRRVFDQFENIKVNFRCR